LAKTDAKIICSAVADLPKKQNPAEKLNFQSQKAYDNLKVA
jgi:hypothetical protein